MGLFNLFGGRDLRSALQETKKVKINGVIFKIRKLSVLDFLDGSKVLQKAFQTYEEARISGKAVSESSSKAIKDHYRDVFMSSVVSPKLSRKQGEDGVFVDEIFTDMEMTEKLYLEISELTYGKKKLQSVLEAQKA